MELAKIRRAVEMTARCRRVEYNYQVPKETRWIAELWCNAVGQCVSGVGPDAWTAVQAAHAECARYESNPHLKPPF